MFLCIQHREHASASRMSVELQHVGVHQPTSAPAVFKSNDANRVCEDSQECEATATQITVQVQQPVSVQDEQPMSASVSMTDQQAVTHVGVESWSVMKRKRPRQPNEKNESAKQKHPMLSGCSEKCKRNCKSKVPEERRREIYDSYWGLNYNQRRLWMNGAINRCSVRRRRVAGESSRSTTLVYTFPNHIAAGDHITVCQKFFLSTLGYSNNRVVIELMKATANAGQASMLVVPQPDQRGKATPPNKKDHEVIEDHIRLFNPQVSHYRREHAPNRLYLESSLSVTFMHSDYCARNPDRTVSYEVYRQAVKRMNISFSEPAADQCDDCAYYEQLDENSFKEQEWKDHLEMAKKARQQYRNDSAMQWPADTAVFAADLQKVLLLPYLHDLKVCVFTSRLVTFNETFARMGKDKTGRNILVVWNESVAGRKKEDVASAFAYVVEKHRDTDKFIFWLDNCASQNKNWSFYTMLCKLVNSSSTCSPSEITVKYLVAGHTHMDADSIHGHVEKAMRRKKDVYDMDDLVEVMKNSNRRNDVHVLTPQNFRDWPAENRSRTVKGQSIPLLRTIVQAKFVRGTSRMFYKTDFDDVDEKSVNFLKQVASSDKNLASMPPARQCNRGLSSAKKAGIIEKLVPRMPTTRRTFWHNLPENANSQDLLNSLES